MSLFRQNQYFNQKEPSDLASFYDAEAELCPFEEDFCNEELLEQLLDL